MRYTATYVGVVVKETYKKYLVIYRFRKKVSQSNKEKKKELTKN